MAMPRSLFKRDASLSTLHLKAASPVLSSPVWATPFLFLANPAEKAADGAFPGGPALDQQFVSAYVRFTDDTAKDLLAQFQRAGLPPSPDASFVAVWEPGVARLNSSHSLRILFEEFSSAPRHFFHAGIDGVVTVRLTSWPMKCARRIS